VTDELLSKVVDKQKKRILLLNNFENKIKEDTLMCKGKTKKDASLEEIEAESPRDMLDEILQEGARRMLQSAIENEAAEYVEKFSGERDENGYRKVVRNGYLPGRELITGMGPVPVKQPRIDDRKMRDDHGYEQFTSEILPKYMRRIPSIDNLIPMLYLKGISTGDFSRALEAILGPDAPGLSATNIVRLKAHWEEEYKDWSKRDLSGKEYVYIWADGVYFNVRLDDERQCLLVLMGADKEGNKELIAVHDGYRESKLSWQEILEDLKERGLFTEPKLAIGDGGLGFWAALRETYSGTKEQRCWVHKTANILDKLPKSMRSKTKEYIHEMYQAESKEKAFKVVDKFVNLYEDKYPKAVQCLTKDQDVLFTFYDFPAKHWSHIRSTNPIESVFATVRLRTKRTKGCGSRIATLTMVHKLMLEASRHWRKLIGYQLIPLVMSGRKFEDGLLKEAA